MRRNWPEWNASGAILLMPGGLGRSRTSSVRARPFATISTACGRQVLDMADSSGSETSTASPLISFACLTKVSSSESTKLRPAIDGLETAAAAGQPLRPAADLVSRTVESQILRFDTRQEVIDTGNAASRAGVLAALQPVANVIPHAAFSAQPGDAISILGDDYLVDAKIDVDGRPHSFRLFRISREPEEWLFVSREPGGHMIRMSPVTPPERGTIIADTDLRQFAAGTGDGEVTGERGSDGLRAVRYALLEAAEDPDGFGLILDWDGARQAFVGQRTEPLDVEVFRRTETVG